MNPIITREPTQAPATPPILTVDAPSVDEINMQ